MGDSLGVGLQEGRVNWGRAMGGMPCLFTRLCCSPLDTLRPVKMLAAPVLCEAKPDEVDTDPRRAVEAIGRAHDGGGRVEPRPAAKHAGTGVGEGLGAGGHGVTFKGCLTPRCEQRNPV